MTSKQALRQNGDDGTRQVKDELDQVTEVLDSSDANQLLELVNAGLGNYDEKMLFGQGESYRKGLIAHTGFSSLVTKRAILQTKKQLAREGITFWDDKGNTVDSFDPMAEDDIGDKQSRWNAEREYGEEIWQRLGDAAEPIPEKQLAAVIKTTGLEPGQWIPMFWDMFVGKHEMSRSLNAELVRLYLGDMYTFRGGEEEAEQTKNSILRRRS